MTGSSKEKTSTRQRLLSNFISSAADMRIKKIWSDGVMQKQSLGLEI